MYSDRNLLAFRRNQLIPAILCQVTVVTSQKIVSVFDPSTLTFGRIYDSLTVTYIAVCGRNSDRERVTLVCGGSEVKLADREAQYFLTQGKFDKITFLSVSKI
jgi:hypothetical protein